MHLNESEMEFFRRRPADDPAVVADERIKQYAEDQGGLVLDYWRLSLGRIWGEPIMMTADEVTKRLNVSDKESESIFNDTMKACGYLDA